MKRRTKILIGLTALFAGTLTLAGCSVWDTPYDRLERDGVTAKVRYDANGGLFSNSRNRNIVDAFDGERAKQGVKLVEPGSDKRGSEAQILSTVSRTGYFLAGWYRERAPRTDAGGNPLDDYGVLCSESGREQGYTYGGKWDFENDLFITEETDKDKVALTLYAAWVPNFTFSFYAKNAENEWELADTVVINPTLQSTELALPYWEDLREGVDPAACSGSMTYGSFPSVEGKTFSKLYADPDMTQEVTTASITHGGRVDLETATAVGDNVNYYLDLLDGVWFHIYTAEQFSGNVRTDGCYELFDDITFTDKVTWGAGFARGDFTGKIYGNRHTIRGLKVEQTDTSQLRGGLFGRIMAGAAFKDVTFENVAYYLNAATRRTGGEFGLFAGNIQAEAVFENVTVSGTLHIGNVYTNYNNYTVGLLCSNPASAGLNGISYTIDCVADEVVIGSNHSYPHKVSVGADGIVTISRNEDPTQNPNGSQSAE